MIAAPLQNTYHNHLLTMKHLNGLQLANPVTRQQVSDIYYWKFVGDHIVRGEGPTAMQSKLGYLLSGPLTPTISSVLHISIPLEEDTCSSIWDTKLTSTDTT